MDSYEWIEKNRRLDKKIRKKKKIITRNFNMTGIFTAKLKNIVIRWESLKRQISGQERRKRQDSRQES